MTSLLRAVAARWRVATRRAARFHRLWLPIAGGFLLSCGCYSPMSGQPQFQSYPGQMQPGTVYPGTVYPGSTYPGGTYSPGTPTYTPTPDGGNAPYYDSGTSSNTGNRPVPDYDDAATSPYFPDSGTASSPNWDTPGAAASPSPTPSGTSPFGDTAEDFHEPIPAGTEPISFERDVTSLTRLPYGYDPAQHQWVQGVVSYDARQQAWGIVYNINPDPADPHAGYLTLGDDPRLASLKDGDVIRVDGEVDPSRPDMYNRATYEVSRITPISQ
jgi:hypothetical protein